MATPMTRAHASCCASCGAAASSPSSAPSSSSTLPLSRCGSCKWVAYCSKNCQRQHWQRGNHRALCATLRSVAAFRDCETRFWTTRSFAELAHFAETQDGLDPASMRFYGEVLFVLAGLKPCMLFSNVPPAWHTRFVTDVVLASGVVTGSYSLRVVAANVATRTEYALRYTLVLVNTSHPTCAAIDRTLRLRSVTLDGDLPVYSNHDLPEVIVAEAELAHLLDYPVALDECSEPMIEVGYFAVARDGSRELLLSYCASASAAHAVRIRAHFARYQRPFDAATLTLALKTTPLS